MLLDGKEIVEDEKEEKQKRTEGSHSQGKSIFICKSSPLKKWVFFTNFTIYFDIWFIHNFFLIILIFLQSHCL